MCWPPTSISLLLLPEEINMTKDTQLESPRAPNSLASFISPTLQELSQLSPSADSGTSSTGGGSGGEEMRNSNGVVNNNTNGGLLVKKSPTRAHQQVRFTGFLLTWRRQRAVKCSVHYIICWVNDPVSRK